MTLNIRKVLLGVLAVVLGSLAVYLMTNQTFGAISYDFRVPTDQYKLYEFFASTTASTGSVSSTVLATSTSATSTNITAFMTTTGLYENGAMYIAGAKKVTFFFTRGDNYGGGNTGMSVFRVQVSRDGTNWDYASRLIGVDASGTATSSVTIQAATSTFVGSLDLTNLTAAYARCIVVETTDGWHQCTAAASY